MVQLPHGRTFRTHLDNLVIISMVTSSWPNGITELTHFHHVDNFQIFVGVTFKDTHISETEFWQVF